MTTGSNLQLSSGHRRPPTCLAYRFVANLAVMFTEEPLNRSDKEQGKAAFARQFAPDEIPIDFVPINHVPPRLNVIRPPVLVFEIMRVLPKIKH
mgnify:CR=1 FL=1